MKLRQGVVHVANELKELKVFFLPFILSIRMVKAYP